MWTECLESSLYTDGSQSVHSGFKRGLKGVFTVISWMMTRQQRMHKAHVLKSSDKIWSYLCFRLFKDSNKQLLKLSQAKYLAFSDAPECFQVHFSGQGDFQTWRLLLQQCFTLFSFIHWSQDNVKALTYINYVCINVFAISLMNLSKHCK